MAYTNAIFYIDLYGGGVGDAARANLVPSAYANNGAGLVRVTVGSLGAVPIVTGAVVTIAGTTSSLYVGDWKVTVIDPNTIDLQGSAFTSNPATKGTCVPFGGSSWADAWLTITSGATAARIAPGDIIRISKSPDPVGIGNATWTDGSHTITLANAQTATIEICETAWTAAANVTTATTTYVKMGSYSTQMTFASAFTTGKAAYKQLASALDLSAYQKLSFQFRNESALAAATLRLCLCSDTTGDVIVDSFVIPAIPTVAQFLPLTIARTGGGNLGSNINSIALYADIDPGTQVVKLDCIIASTQNGLSLQSLISKNSLAKGGTELWHAIQSINGTTIYIDSTIVASPTSANAVYSGATETVQSYFRETFKTAFASSTLVNVNTINKAGSNSNYIEFSGGFEVGTTNQNGDTIYDGITGNGVGLYNSRQYIKVNGCSFVRLYNGILTSAGNYSQYNIFQCSSNSSIGISIQSDIETLINAINLSYNGNGIIFGQASDHCTIELLVNSNCNGDGIYFNNSRNNVITELRNANRNTQNGLNLSSSNNIQVKLVKNLLYNASSAISLSSGNSNTFSKIESIIGSSYPLMFSSSFDNKFDCINSITNVGTSAMYFAASYNNKVRVLSASGGTYGVNQQSGGRNYLVDSTLNQATKVNLNTSFVDSCVFSLNDGGITGNHKIYTVDGYVNMQSSVVHDTDPVAWKTVISGNTRKYYIPIRFKLAEVAFVANKAITVKAWVKKDHATNVGCRLITYDNNTVGIVETSTTKANDTNWEQISITFTPTAAGVTEIWFESWYVTGNSNTYVGSIEITQA